MSSAEPSDVDASLNAQLRAAAELRERCLYRSALRAAGEARRAAEAERRLIPYLTASFYEMNAAQSTFDPALGREAAVRTIALLESADAARAFQGDYDEAAYEHTAGWMTACAYDNLATHTGQLQGYNSPGMQACVADGIAVCRRTGKLRCITCFREYATQVFRAADDVPMALHHARGNAAKPIDRRGDDRRFVGSRDEALLLLLSGDPDAAWAAGQRTVRLAATYHSAADAATEARWVLLQAATVADRADWLAEATALPAVAVPADEHPAQDWRDALLAGLSGDGPAALDTLARWDKRLSDAGCLSDWFETRLRLVALYRRAGQDGRAAALCTPLRAKATAAQDFLTLNRLDRLLDPAVVPSPLATVAPPAGPAAVTPPPVLPTVARPAAGPMDDVYAALGQEVQQRLAAGDEHAPPDLLPVLAMVLTIPPERLARAADAARFLHLLGFLSRQPTTDARRTWDWAKRAAAAHPQSADVLGLLGALGDQLRQVDPSLADAVPPAELADLFRRAMDLAPDGATAFGRAGLFFLHQGDDAEAERCLARAFRLDRSNAFIARELSDLYGHTDRLSDGLAVLDLCLRESPPDAADPEVLWKAGLAATSLDRAEAAVTYLSQLEQLQPGRQWVAYYRAIGLLGLKRFPEAAVAIEREAGLVQMPTALHVHTVRAAAAAGVGDAAAVRRHVDAAVRPPLSSVTYLSRAGVVGCFTRLWAAAAVLDDDDTVRARLKERLLASGLTPAEVWADARSAGHPIQDLTHYWCDMRQPLDERWAAAGHAMPGTEGWTAYRVRYGVLAADASDAAQRAVAWQRRSAPLPPDVESVAVDAGPFTDAPGVTRRGYPEAAE